MLVNLPPLGWNSWNTFGTDISETVILENANALIDSGLDKLGYRYVVIDDGWSERERDPRTRKLVPSGEKFPGGISALAGKLHQMGLKLGIYSCAGVMTCARYPGSFGFEFLDAQTFAEWGVDFLKYDFCHKPESANGPLLYRRMGNALRLSGREILFSACNWGFDRAGEWMRAAGAHMYRSGGDIHDNPVSMRDIVMQQLDKFCFSGPQCFNDLDMLTIGMFGRGHVGTSGGSMDHYRTQMGIWCIAGSPLFLGCDLRNMDAETLALLSNRILLDINQDPECRQPFVMRKDPGGVLMTKLLADGDLAIGFFNLTNADLSLTLLMEDIGFPVGCGISLRLTDAFDGNDAGSIALERTESLPPFGCKVYRAAPERSR